MAKFSLAWHENNLKNFNASLESKREQLNRLQSEVEVMCDEQERREHQIAEAKRRKVKEFDADKFAVPTKGVKPGKSWGITFKLVEEGEEWIEGKTYREAVEKLESRLNRIHPDRDFELETVTDEDGEELVWDGRDQETGELV